MRARRDILISALLVGVQVGILLLLLGQSGLGQPGGGTAGTVSVPAVPPDLGLRARLGALLPAPGTTAQFMQAQTRLSVIDFQQRVTQSGGDLKVLANVLGQAQQGTIPSYDERLGITQAEFQRYLYLIFSKTLEPSGRTVKLALTREGSRLSFGDAGGASILKGLSIDLSSGELTTAEGFSARPRSVQISPAKDATGMGASSGLAWDVRGSNPRSQNALQGHLSLLQYGGGQVLLSYNRVSILKGRISEDNVTLMYRK